MTPKLWIGSGDGARRTFPNDKSWSAGLWGNHGYEAYYAFVWTDEDGQPLDGTNAVSCGWSRLRRWMPSGR